MDNRNHLFIPKERVTKEKYEKHGGGNSYKRGDLASHGRVLKKNFDAIAKIVQSSFESQITDQIFVAVKTADNWPIKNEKLHLQELGAKIIDYSRSSPEVATISISKSDWKQLGEKISNYAQTEGVGKTKLQAIDGFQKRPIDDVVAVKDLENGSSTINASIALFSILKKKEAVGIAESIKEDLVSKGDYCEVHELSTGHVLISCNAKPKSLINLAEGYFSIQSISKNEFISIEKMDIAESNMAATISPTSKTNQIIAVIDDGISARPDISHLVRNRSRPAPQGAVSIDGKHGTFVASRCLFGDIQGNAGGVLLPVCKVDDLPVFGLDWLGNEVKPSEVDLILAIDDYVSANSSSVKVYNLSLGYGNPIAINAISNCAKVLDVLSKKHGVLFVISSGNINAQISNFPHDHFLSMSAKICSPAESFLSISVGSIAKQTSQISLVNINQISPFSKIGPGLNGSIKPDFVAHGGNLENGYKTCPSLSAFGLGKNSGILAANVGTSFSAPLLSHYAVQLFDFYAQSSVNLIKAILVHFSETRDFPAGSTLPSHYGCGYGEPQFNACFITPSNSCVFMYEGELDRENYDFVPFHFPAKLANEHSGKITVKYTIVYDPEVNLDNSDEYSSARISSTILSTKGGDYHQKPPSDKDISDSYYPIIRSSTSYTRSFESGEWAIRLRLYTRNIDDENYKQKYAVIIEIIDEANGIDVRNAVLAETSGVYVSRTQMKNEMQKAA